MTFKIIQIDLIEHLDLLLEYCENCKKLGYNNNNSLESLKLYHNNDLLGLPDYWAILKQNKIITLSGSHKFSETQQRCLFRSATIDNNQIVKTLSKTHMLSLPFSILLPFQILDGLKKGIKEFIITTSNSDLDQSGKMGRTHRVLNLLSKQKIVDFVRNDTIFHVPQSVWKINLENYYQAIINFDSVRSNLNLIGLEDQYQYIKKNGFNI